MAISPDIKRKAVNFVNQSVEHFRSQRNDLETNWVNYDRAYRAMYDQDEQFYKGDSMFATPIIHDNVEAIVARGSEAAIIGEKSVDIEASPEERQKAQIYKMLSIKQADLQDIDEKKERVWRMGAKYGTAVVKQAWVETIEPTTVRELRTEPVLDDNGDPIIDPNTGAPITEQRVIEEERDIVQYVGPGYEMINDLRDIYWDRFVENIQDQPIVVQRVFLDWDTINQGVKDGVYSKEVASHIKDNPYIDSSDYQSQAEEIAESIRETVSIDGTKKLWEVYEAWCDFDLDGDGFEEPTLITVVGNQLLGIRENPYWHKKKPYHVFKYREVEGEAYGIGAVQPVYNLYKDYNDSMNQYNDAKAFLLNPMLIRRAGAADRKGDIDIKPGGIIDVKQAGDIAPLPMDLNHIVTNINVLSELEARINKGMGITQLLNGSGDQSDLDKTWRATKTVIGQADKKFKRIAIRFEQHMWKAWLEMGLKLNSQFLDTLDPFFNDQDINFPINAQQVVGNYSFTVKGVEAFFDLQDRLDKTMQFAQLTAGQPWVNSMALGMQVAEMMGLKNLDQIFVEPVPPPKTPDKPASVSVQLNPKDGLGIAAMALQVLNQGGYEIDGNMALDDAEIIGNRMNETQGIVSGFMPDRLEEDIIENAGNDANVEKKVELVTGEKPKAEITKTETV